LTLHTPEVCRKKKHNVQTWRRGEQTESTHMWAVTTTWLYDNENEKNL